MLTVIIIAVVIIGVAVILSYKNDKNEKPYTETICGNCGGPDCIVDCDKPSTVEECHKPENKRLATEDEIRHSAYLLAADDNFNKSPETYWHQAEKLLNGAK